MADGNSDASTIYEDGIEKVAKALEGNSVAILGALTDISNGYKGLDDRLKNLEQEGSDDEVTPEPVVPDESNSVSDYAVALYHDVISSINDKDYDIALGFLEHADLTKGEVDLFYVTRGTVYILEGDVSLAIPDLEKVCSMPSSKPEIAVAAKQNLAVMHLLKGEVDEAYELVPDLNPEEAEIVVYAPEWAA